MEPEWGNEPGSAGYKAIALPFELSFIDNGGMLSEQKRLTSLIP